MCLYFFSDSGSSSSGSESGNRSGSDKSSVGDASRHSNNSKSPKSSNHNSSKSDQQSDKGSSEEDRKRKFRNSKLKSDLWEENPDIYGIRRSARSRKEPDRLKVADSDSSDRGRSHRKNSKKRYVINRSYQFFVCNLIVLLKMYFLVTHGIPILQRVIVT